jgi:hypothetical protein
MSDTIAVPKELAEEWLKSWRKRPEAKCNADLWDLFRKSLWEPPVTKVQWVDVKDHPYPVDRAILVDRDETWDFDAGVDIDTYHVPGCGEVKRWAMFTTE